MQPSPSSASFAAALSTREDAAQAAAEVCSAALEQLGGAPHLALLFVSAHHSEAADQLAASVCQQLGCDCLLGCSGESIVGVGREVELEPAMSLWVARLPGATLLPMHLEYQRTAEGGSFTGWPDGLPDRWPQEGLLLICGDPFTFPADLLLELVNQEHPGVPVVGGMASAGQGPGQNRLLLGRRAFDRGAAAVLLYGGGVRVTTVLSQGCRPIGQPLVITKAERNVIYELGGTPAYQRLKEVFDALPTRDQQMLQRGLHVGRVVSEYRDHFEQGDFLVRNVVGVDPDEGAIAIGDYVRVGQTVQFHVRDGGTADAELRGLLAGVGGAAAAPAAALLFTCNGRGTRLFDQPHHDAAAIGNSLGEIPLAGFFAAGELGPVGGQNFTHGFTASIALFSAS